MTSVKMRPIRHHGKSRKAPPAVRLHVVGSPSPGGLDQWSDTVLETSHGAIAIRQSTGRGMPVLFLHGNSSSKDAFRRQFESELGTRLRFVAMDFPGHGASSNAIDPQRSYSIPGYAAAAVEVLEILGIDHAALLGWSLGGHVALEMATCFPGVTGTMIIGAPPVGTALPDILAGFKPNPLLGLTGKADLTAEELVQFEDMTLNGVNEDGLREDVRRTDGRARAMMFAHLTSGLIADERKLVETSGLPLAVVNGADDPVVNLDYVSGLAYAKLWRRRCHIIPRARHAPFLEQPAPFNHLLAQFMRQLEGRFRAQNEHASLCFSG